MKDLLLSIIVLLPLCSQAQNVGYDIDAEGDIKLAKRLHLSIDAEARSQQGLSELERLAIGAGVDYRLSKRMKAEAGYIFIMRYDPFQVTSKGNTINSYWSPRHRYYLGATGSYKLNRFDLSLRERVQYTHRPLQYIPKYSGEDGHRMTDHVLSYDDEFMLRSRLGVKYNIRHCDVTPFASIEMFNDFGSSFSVDQMRYIVGAEYKLNKKNDISLSYRCKSKTNDDDEPGSHLISIGFSHSF